jgi:alkylation response protein AidB-like acyl-CoA dehydrogenase
MTRIDDGRRDLLAWDAAHPKNYFTRDPNLMRTLRMRLGRDRFEAEKSELTNVGEISANDLLQLSRETNLDENLPRLDRYSGLGERTEEVVFHPAYHQIGKLIWSTGVLARYREPGSETVQLGMSYMMAQHGELGHACPLACTAGLIKVLMAAGSEQQKSRYLPGLFERSYEKRYHASQFLTEVQGGSDVGANAVVAKPEPNSPNYRIHGEKWFCSVADATLFLMTARPEGAPEGTRGLGAFLVPRITDGQTNEFYLRRLKRKLGTRAMASAEIDFRGALAEPIGPLDRGFKNVVERVLDTSRVYNAVVCAASMRRAYVEASLYAKHRRAFGTPIFEFALVKEALSTLQAEAIAATSATFRLLAEGDRAVRGEVDERGLAARRVAVNVNKYWTSVRNTQMVRLAMEVFGGNGTIESFSVLPQLYRDSMVLESWEGTHNVLVAQVLRDAERLQLDRAFVEEMVASVMKLGLAGAHGARAEKLLTGLAAFAKIRGPVDQRYGRRIVDQMAIVHAGVAMLEELAENQEDRTLAAAFDFIMERDLKTELSPPAELDEALLIV